ncbi:MULTISPECIES: YciI family protein [unclassified Streptomyces]|uniref:YciI family protein n=1 Tax=unclassified Streptomyces TaxID=2593676 RepID=UPI002DD7EC75|nr:YciI family protein [Streptomyces sp. NBC_01750]WSA98408.1 YciI family protein [Streptomyces sp. NBC_01794]WSD37056.1 YciI family protein [Streptomyces sp. NBC_01750]
MKYMLLMQFSEQTADFPSIGTWAPEEIQAHIAFMKDANKKIADAGEFVDAQGLAMPEQARIVRAGEGGAPLITEGPYPETKEFLAGYWIVDCDTPERAYTIAAHVSAAPGPGGAPLNMAIEVRQVMSAPTEEL